MKAPTAKTFRTSLLTAAVLSAFQPVVAQETESDGADSVEIISVTANRRSQSITSVPYNISAIGGEKLKEAGITDIGDLTARIPGVAFTDRGARSGAFSSSLSMRGLSLEDGRISSPLYTAPGVSTYIGETPLFANIRFYDIERVEVLRGPQGTLYGSSSLGGTLRFIPNLPETDLTLVEVDATISQTDNGDGINHETNIVANLPLSETFAIRANIGVDDAAGWIDQPSSYVLDPQGVPQLANSGDYLNSPAEFVSREGINGEKSVYGRIAALWQISDDTRLVVAYNKQDDDSDSNPSRAVDYQDLDDYESAALTTEPYSGETELVSADAEMDLGYATFSASVSHYESDMAFESDQTGAYQAFDFYAASYGAMPRPLIADYSTNQDEADIVELRMVSSNDGPLNWIIGGFMMEQDIKITNFQFFRGYADWADACAADLREDCGLGTTTGEFSLIFDPGTHPAADAVGLAVVKDKNFLASSSATFKDKAIFGELSWAVSDDINITGGFRTFEQTFDNQQINAAFFVDSATANGQNAKERDTLFKLNASWQATEEAMLYATWSEGFRRGGANALPPSVTVFDDEGNGTEVLTSQQLLTYAPDLVTNREFGVKGYIEGVRYTLAAYDIDWKNIQLDTLVTPFLLNAVVNAGEAKSRGFESEFIADISDAFTLSFGYSYTDATLDSPDEFGLNEAGIDPASVNGIRLPGVPKHTASVDARYTWELEDWYLSWNLNANYRSKTRSSLDPATSTNSDGFSIWNTALQLDNDQWSFKLFVNNLTNEEGVINTPHPDPAGPRRNELISRPRVIGLNVSYLFEL